MEFFNYKIPIESDLEILLFIITVTIIAWLISRIIRFFIIIYLKRSKSDIFSKTSIQFLKNSIKFIIGVIAVIFIILNIPELRNKATIIFSGAGILAAIIGFAAQAAISNLIAGSFIVMFKPFRVGDYIKLDETRMGIVEDINLRHTTINNFENKRIIIPNSIISTESVLNHTIEDSHILSFNNFYIGIYANIDLARKIIQEEAAKLPNVIVNRTPDDVSKSDNYIPVNVISTHNSMVHLRAYAWLVNPLEEFSIKCQLREAVHKRFVAEGIEFPKTMAKIYQG